MTFLERNFLDIRNLDLMARGTSWIHRLDPRAKLITSMVFIVTVVSMDKYTISQLIPFVIYPLTLLTLANLPAGYFLKKICLVAPFAALIGLFNPFIDREILMQIGPIAVSGGWISFASIMLRFGLTVGTALVLIGVTSFSGLCMALQQLRVPKIFVVQLLFLYRYLFVLLDEAVRMSRARTLRSLDSSGPGIKTYGSMVGHLLLRATDRAERIHLAMLCRAFNGEIHPMSRSSFGMRDVAFIIVWSLFFLFFRTCNVPEIIGSITLEFLP